MAQALCSWMKRLGAVVDSQSAKSFTAARLEGLPADQRGAGDRVAVLAGLRELLLLGHGVDGTLGNGADARAEGRAVAQRVEMDAEYCAGREAGGRDPLL